MLREVETTMSNRPFAIFLLLLTGCPGAAPKNAGDVQANAQREVLVFAAASTTDAVDEIKRRFEQESGSSVRTSYAGSSTLAQQIFHGAGADVFISADAKWADYIEANSLAAGRRELLGNRLVVIVPKDSTLDLRKPQDLAGEAVKHLAMGDPEAVPAGIYAKQALTKLGVWEAVKAKVVAAADVRQAMAYVETGAADAGIVYATDAAVGKSIKVAVPIDPQWTGSIRYSAVLLKHGDGNPAAQAFYRHLFSPAAAEVFQKHGFIVLAHGTDLP
jgi:molybdate transport system substrate-binding protein